ncbi:hypothetical protein TNIN_273571 [Trichonephila inaurata madagascariensis]|uniref:Uncharacterized protein n=1 Tax=Trichonephila inaurata madagascariensis TaxID=2747483 RepID=A0A8X7CP43_9ARAC|nr:hypothetical protein TNIN_113061 [Trichonephila inaurata madagascariensis]GFY70957.1 hypothetical protein TNIN_273571 [Trichonephila inaurata madagascariensis]
MLLTVSSIDVKVPFPFYLQVNTNDPRQGHRGRPKRLGIMNKLISGRPIPSSGIHQRKFHKGESEIPECIFRVCEQVKEWLLFYHVPN